jgi:hypothetical protein
MAELQECSLTLSPSLQATHDLYFGSLDLELEESLLREIDHSWIDNEDTWFIEVTSLDGGEPRANDMLGEEKTCCPNDTISADGPVGTDPASEDNNSVSIEASSDNSPVGTEMASDNGLVGTEPASEDSPVDTTSGETETVDDNTAKPPTLSTIAPVTVDVMDKGKADAVDTDSSCESHTSRKVPSTLRLPKRKRKTFEGIGIPGDASSDGLYHAKKRRRSVPRKVSNEVLILTRSPYDEGRHPMDDDETGSSDDNHEAGSSEHNPIDLTVE